MAGGRRPPRAQAPTGFATAGEHRVSLPDLLIAAGAQQHGAAVLHHDRHFELLAERFGFGSIRT